MGEAKRRQMVLDGDRTDDLRRLIAARIPEMSAADLVLMAESVAPAEAVSAEVMNALVDVIDALEVKLEALEQGLASPASRPH
jgi:hypothetical protein